jgi:hypothetical protein
MKKRLMLPGLIMIFVTALLPQISQAVPSYARQIKKPCTACHTIWPNLNQYGRQFKVKAYTDVSPEWEMNNKDNLNLMNEFPFSARTVFYPMIREKNNNPTAGTGTALGTTNNGQGATNLDQLAIFMASRVTNYAGVFTSGEADADATTNGTFGIATVKIAFQLPLSPGQTTTDAGAGGTKKQGSTLGLVVFKGISTSADPFNSYGGRDRDLSWQAESAPFVLDSGWTFKSDDGDNVGTVLHGYFIGNRLYAAIGSMRGGTTPNGGFVNQASTDPNDMYSRVAWDQALPNGAVTLGVAYYDGKQRITSGGSFVTPFDAKVKRSYVDLSLEQNLGEDHMLEVQALLGGGKETNVFGSGEERKFDGMYVQGSYFYDRQYGLVASINKIKFKDALATDSVIDPSFGVDKKDSWLVALDFLPWLNTKLALQYSNTKTTFLDPAVSSQTDKITRVVMDILF